jgi:hypothetical protein
MRNISHKRCRENKTHILCSITFFRKSCRLWENVAKYFTTGHATGDNTIRCIRIACWVTKATHTQSEWVIIAFQRQQWLRERASDVTLYVIACLVAEHKKAPNPCISCSHSLESIKRDDGVKYCNYIRQTEHHEYILLSATDENSCNLDGVSKFHCLRTNLAEKIYSSCQKRQARITTCNTTGRHLLAVRFITSQYWNWSLDVYVNLNSQFLLASPWRRKVGWGFDIHTSVHRNIITYYSQQDATFLEFIYLYRRSTCFRRFLRPSSEAHNCTYSFRYCQPILLLAATVEEMELT